MTQPLTDERQQLVQDSISFMQSVVQYYGQEKGMEMWEKLSDICDPDLKGDVFVAMLIGEHSGRITINKVQDSANAVSCIKALRSVDIRGPGLKEAKDMYDGLKFNNKRIIVEVEGKNRNYAVRELRDAGFVI